MENNYDLIIIGSGAAGLAASIYAGRYRMKVLVIGDEFGGYTARAGVIDNYPGQPEMDGYELMKVFKGQAEKLGVNFLSAHVNAITVNNHCFQIKTKDAEFVGNTIIFAVGVERRQLGLPNEDELTGKGVHYCVTCDGPFYKGKTIAMVGGGDASVKGLNLSGEYVKKAYLITREKELTAEPINLENMKKLGDKVEILYETEVKEIVGTDMLDKIKLNIPYQGSDELDIDGLFIEIGAVPNVELAVSLGVELDEHGYIKADNMMKTNVEGVFTAGDTVNHFGGFKQDITAAAMGAVAATSAYEDNKIHGDLCPFHAVPVKTKE